MTLKTNNVRSSKSDAVRDGAVHTTDERTANDVVFYLLGKKFVEDKGDIPDDAKDVIYYTLAMGHNTGVVDCFEPKLALSRKNFDNFLDSLKESDGKRKLSGIEKFGEIQITKDEVNSLKEAISSFKPNDCHFDKSIGRDVDNYESIRAVETFEFKAAFMDLLKKIETTPQVYCLARRVTR